MQRQDSRARKNLQTNRNPVTIAREAHGFTQDEIAAVAGKTRGFVHHLETGLIKRIPNEILFELCATPQERIDLSAEYDLWIYDTRQANKVYLENGLSTFLDNSSGYYGDWGHLVAGISGSQIGFCKLYCMHPQIFRNFNNDWWSRTELTDGVREVFRDCITTDTLKDIDAALLRRNKG